MVSVNITQPLELGVDVFFTNLECFNDCDATATAIVDNGTQPYSYEWTDHYAEIYGKVSDSLACRSENS